MTLLHKRSSVDEASIITKAIIEIKVPMKANIYPYAGYFPAFSLYTLIPVPYLSVTKENTNYFPVPWVL